MAAQPEIAIPWYNSSSNDGSSCLDVQLLSDGTVQTRNTNRPETTVVNYDADEWAAFIGGVKAGKFDRTVTA